MMRTTQCRKHTREGTVLKPPSASGGTVSRLSTDLPQPALTERLLAWIRSKRECPAIRRLLPNTEHRRQKRLNNQAENSHRPVRKRERVMQRSKSPEQAQQFLETSSAVCNHFRARSHRLPPDHAQAFPA